MRSKQFEALDTHQLLHKEYSLLEAADVSPDGSTILACSKKICKIFKRKEDGNILVDIGTINVTDDYIITVSFLSIEETKVYTIEKKKVLLYNKRVG